MPSPPYKISFKSTNRFAILKWLKLQDLVVWNQGRLQCHHLHKKFHPNPPNGSKVIKVFLYTHLRSLNVRNFGMAEATRLKCDVGVTLNGSTCLPNFTKINRSVQKLLVGHTQTQTQTHTHTHTHTHTDRLVI
jgi:hypothetical protein